MNPRWWRQVVVVPLPFPWFLRTDHRTRTGDFYLDFFHGKAHFCRNVRDEWPPSQKYKQPHEEPVPVTEKRSHSFFPRRNSGKKCNGSTLICFLSIPGEEPCSREMVLFRGSTGATTLVDVDRLKRPTWLTDGENWRVVWVSNATVRDDDDDDDSSLLPDNAHTRIYCVPTPLLLLAQRSGRNKGRRVTELHFSELRLLKKYGERTIWRCDCFFSLSWPMCVQS